MEFFRKTCGGRIEELTGKKASLVNTDIYLRSLGLYNVCKQEYDLYPADQRTTLDAFADGVNAYLAGKTPQQLSVNYTILGLTGVKFKIDPWSPLDSLAFAKLMAWDLGLSRDTEMPRSKLYNTLGAEMADKFLVPAWPNGLKPTILLPDDIQSLINSSPDGTQSRNEGPKVDIALKSAPVDPASEEAAPDLSWLIGDGGGVGSNSWVANGNMTQSGKPLLANDPHLGIQMPSIWYEVDLHCNDDVVTTPFDVAGFTFASNPGVVVGHNNDIAWGTTNVYPDVNDQYQIKINPDNPLQYQWNGQWRDMNVREETINFGDGKPAITIKVRETHLGPILNENNYDAKSGELQGFNNTDPLALHWTALEPSNLSLAIMGLTRLKIGTISVTPSNTGTFLHKALFTPINRAISAIRCPARYPSAPRTTPVSCRPPVWSDEYIWKGYIPYDLLPRSFNPARGFIVAANEESCPSRIL